MRVDQNASFIIKNKKPNNFIPHIKQFPPKSPNWPKIYFSTKLIPVIPQRKRKNMNSPMQFNPHWETYSKNWTWFLLCGLALVILGAVAIAFDTFTTLISVIFLAILILCSGIVIIVDSFASWWGRWRGFFIHLLMGILYAAAGVILLRNPVLASVSLTLLLAIMYIFIGIFRIIYSLSMRVPQWGWSFFSGILALLLGILILAKWPESSLFIIGLFVGIDLMITGWVYIMAAFAARELAHK
jgi:uncharacterized membrane protein HdeD (DUF308 family)